MKDPSIKYDDHAVALTILPVGRAFSIWLDKACKKLLKLSCTPRELAVVIDDARYEAEANERNVQFSGDAAVTVRGSAELLHRAIENVVRNATRHTAIGTIVWVRSEVDTEEKRMRISVLDHGPGMPESELEKIFAPFFRSELKTLINDGHGLGLAIARRVVEKHGGSIHAANRPTGGLCVDITLPVASFGTPDLASSISNAHFPEFNATAANGIE